MAFRWLSTGAIAIAVPAAAGGAGPQSVSFSCDAPAGQVAVMDENHLPVSTAISGSLRALQMREDSVARPTATVRLASRKDFVALQVSPTEPNSNTFTVFVRNGDGREEERTAIGEMTLNQSMPFRIALEGKDVVVAAGAQTISIRQRFRDSPRVGVSCTTGRFLFDNVAVH